MCNTNCIKANEYSNNYMPGYGDFVLENMQMNNSDFYDSKVSLPPDMPANSNGSMQPGMPPIQNRPTNPSMPPNSNIPMQPNMPQNPNIPMPQMPSFNSPFYDYDNSNEGIRDKEYIVFLYPIEARQLLDIINKELDKLNYEGSVIFHEYPDKDNLEQIISLLHKNNESITNIDHKLLQTLFIDEMINRRRQYFNNIYRK